MSFTARLFQGNFDSHLKTVCEMTEVGETVARVDTLIKEAAAFQKLCTVSSLNQLKLTRHEYHEAGVGTSALNLNPKITCCVRGSLWFPSIL
jgi:hypothetical protein